MRGFVTEAVGPKSEARQASVSTHCEPPESLPRPDWSLAVMSLPGQGQSSAQLCSRGPPPALAALLQAKLPMQATRGPAGKGLLPSSAGFSVHIMSSIRVNEGTGPSAALLLDPSGLTSSRGRVVKPRQWDDGTETAPPSSEPL